MISCDISSRKLFRKDNIYFIQIPFVKRLALLNDCNIHTFTR